MIVQVLLAATCHASYDTSNDPIEGGKCIGGEA
jgi:hypothetical protein